MGNNTTAIQIQNRDPNLETAKLLAAKWDPEFGKARDLQTPYNELFADLVGVLYANDVMAMTDAMISPEMPEPDRVKTAYYGFARQYDLATWNETEVHFYFAPVRAFIGEKFLHFPMTDVQKAAVIKKVYQSCLSEIQKYWNSSLALSNPSEANRSLIDALLKTHHP